MLKQVMAYGWQNEAFSRDLSMGGGRTVRCQLMNCIACTSLIFTVKVHFVSEAHCSVGTLSLLFVFEEINASQASREQSFKRKHFHSGALLPAGHIDELSPAVGSRGKLP